jgi:polysaccharide pyruvyl transferase WcaK-like protein
MQPFGLPDPSVAGPKICFVNFTGFRSNWGCQATSFELLKMTLRALSGQPAPHISFTPLLEPSPLDAELDAQIDAIHAAIVAAAQDDCDSAKSLRYLEDICIRRYAPWTEAAKAADVLVFQAEGSLSGRLSFCDGIGVVLLPFVAKRAWGKRVISLNQTLYSAHEGQIAAIRAALNTFDVAAVREGSSVDFARANAIPVSYIPDLAFLASPGPDPNLPDFATDARYFAVTGSALKEPNKAEQTIDLAERIAAKTARIPVFVASSDQSIINLAAKRWKSADYLFVPRETHYPGVAHALQRCDFLVGGRYHMAILAAAVGTPTLLTRGNTPKNEGLAAMLRSRFPVQALEQADLILNDADALCREFSSVKAELTAAVSAIVSEIRRAEPYIAAALTSDTPAPAFMSSLPTFLCADNTYYAGVSERKKMPKTWPVPQPITARQTIAALTHSCPDGHCADQAVQTWIERAADQR